LCIELHLADEDSLHCARSIEAPLAHAPGTTKKDTHSGKNNRIAFIVWINVVRCSLSAVVTLLLLLLTFFILKNHHTQASLVSNNCSSDMPHMPPNKETRKIHDNQPRLVAFKK
jgi:hypothetical protein